MSALACLVAALLAGTGARAQPARVALVIGNGTYTAQNLPPLPGCVASARAVGGALRALGYDVTERLDVGRGQMDAALAAFARRLREAREDETVAVAYVCGHVMTSGARPFLLPVNANLARESDLLSQGILARAVPDALVRAEVRAGLVALDAAAAGADPLGFDVLASATSGRVALLLAGAEASADRATPLAEALQAGFAGPSVRADRLVADLRARLGTGGRVAGSVPDEANFGTTPAAPAAPEPPRVAASDPRPTVAAPLRQGSAPSPTPPDVVARPSPRVPAPTRPAATSPALTSPALGSTDEARMTEADRRRVQAALAAMGYYSGRVDGAFGAETRAAIRRFQFEVGDERTGILTPVQATRLTAQR